MKYSIIINYASNKVIPESKAEKDNNVINLQERKEVNAILSNNKLLETLARNL